MNLELTKKSVLLIGDTIVDRYVYLKPTGFSLETPTVKCELLNKKEEFGGAANVVKLLVGAGCKVDFWTSISSDLANRLQISCNANLFRISDETQVKERYYITKNETYKYLQVNDCKQSICKYPHSDFQQYDTIVLSDYRLGAVSHELLHVLPKEKTVCQMQISDSKDTLEKYKNFNCIIGNEDEIPHETISDFAIRQKLTTCVSTQGSSGAFFFDGKKKLHVPAVNLAKLKDYHGAGDAFFAGFVAAYDLSHFSLEKSVISGISFSASFLTREGNIHEA